MPDDIWRDVHWNHRDAEEAIATLQRTADELEQTARERADAARNAMTEFRGPHRDTFDANLRRMQARAHDLARTYRDAATRIRQTSEWARREQRRREQERTRANNGQGC